MELPDVLRPGNSIRPPAYRAYNPNDGLCSLPEVCVSHDEANEGLEKSLLRHQIVPDEKETAGGFASEQSSYAVLPDIVKEASGQHHGDQSGVANSKFRRSLQWFSAAFVITLVLGIALGLGLGIGLKHGQKPDGLAAPSDFSTRGAFNGTRISVMSNTMLTNLTSGLQVAPVAEEDGNILMFFQHHTGVIRWMQRAWSGEWYSGTANELVAADARNATPISALATISNGTEMFHVFYINNQNQLRQRFITNSTDTHTTWADGLINELDLSVLTNGSVGLQACFYMGPIRNANLEGTTPTAGIRLWIALEDASFHQYAWRSHRPEWIYEESWETQNLNPRASPACYGWDSGKDTYVMFLNPQNEIKMYWRDTSGHVYNSPDHPIDTWTPSSIAFPKVDPEAGLSWHAKLFAKLPGGRSIQGWNMTFDSEKSTADVWSFVEGEPGDSETQLDVWSLPPGAAYGDEEEIMVVYQTQGDDITLQTFHVANGTWSTDAVPIPNEISWYEDFGNSSCAMDSAPLMV